MGHNNGIISTSGSGISVLADIAEVLGVGSGDVGTLCKSNSVNMWSKYKPIKYASWVTNGGGSVDSDGNPYGINRPQHDDIQQIASSQISWVKPTGGSSSPYRVLDFDGYNHNCECPWIIQMPPVNLPKWTQTSTMSVKFLDKGGLLPTNNVSIGDLYPGKYFCVFINGYYKTLGSGDSTLNISGCPAYRYAQAGSTLTIMCAMCSEQIGDPTDYTDWQNGGVDAMFYSLASPEYATVQTCTIYTPQSDVYEIRTPGIAANDRGKLSWGTTTYNNGNGYFYRTATCTSKLNNSYELQSAAVYAKLHSSSEILYSDTIDTSNCQVPEILKGETMQGFTISFSAPVNVLAMQLPPAPYGDYYDIYVELTYDII